MFHRLDNSPISGIFDIDGYVDIQGWTPTNVKELIRDRFNGSTAKMVAGPAKTPDVYIPKIRRPPTDLEQRRFLRESFNEFNARNEKIFQDVSASEKSHRRNGILGILQSNQIEKSAPQTAAAIPWNRSLRKLEIEGN